MKKKTPRVARRGKSDCEFRGILQKKVGGAGAGADAGTGFSRPRPRYPRPLRLHGQARGYLPCARGVCAEGTYRLGSMPRGRNAKKNGPSFYQTCREAGESEDELEQGPSKASAPAGRSSARGSKRGQAADEAIDVDELPERDANKAQKHHESAGAAGNVASDSDEDHGSEIGARAAPSEFGARAGRATRFRTASNQASPLAPELPDRKRGQSRPPSPFQGAAAARRRTPTLRSVEAQQQSAEAAAARESRARRRNGTSPPKARYDLESEMEGDKEGSACSEVECIVCASVYPPHCIVCSEVECIVCAVRQECDVNDPPKIRLMRKSLAQMEMRRKCGEPHALGS